MATHCTRCGRFLEATVKNPVIALSTGTYDYDCYKLLQVDREEAVAKEREVEEEKAAEVAARRFAASIARSERMKARWAAKKGVT